MHFNVIDMIYSMVGLIYLAFHPLYFRQGYLEDNSDETTSDRTVFSNKELG